MPYSALVLQLLLSAPGDLPEPHKALIQRSVCVWNNDQARFYGIYFSPTDWREGGTPAFGQYAQDVLNEQIVVDSDAGIVVFTDRLGTPTPDHESGTAEEIDRLRAGGKEVAVLLNKVHRQPLTGPALEEKVRLDHYINKIGKQAFIGEYDSDHRLAEVVGTLLTRIANKYRRDLDRSTQTATARGVPPGEPDDEEPEDVGNGVWPRTEAKDSVEADSRGQLHTQHEWQLVLESNMDQPVTGVTLAQPVRARCSRCVAQAKFSLRRVLQKESAMKVDEILAVARDSMTVRRVYAEPVERDGVTVIAAASVTGGGGAGSGIEQGKEGSGGGFGLGAKPVGAYVIKDGRVTWRPAIDFNRLITVIGVVVLAGIVAGSRIARKAIGSGHS